MIEKQKLYDALDATSHAETLYRLAGCRAAAMLEVPFDELINVLRDQIVSVESPQSVEDVRLLRGDLAAEGLCYLLHERECEQDDYLEEEPGPDYWCADGYTDLVMTGNGVMVDQILNRKEIVTVDDLIAYLDTCFDAAEESAST